MNFDFKGKRVLVTGAGSGLGKQLAIRFSESGAQVFALDVNEKSLAELKAAHPNMSTVRADLSNWEETQKAVESCGTLHHLINNAGIITHDSLLDFPEANFDKTMDINFKAVFRVSQVFAKNVVKLGTKDATIVNISSVAGQKAVPYTPIYCCSKAAVDMLTKSMAIEFATYGIRVNAIAPGAMSTPMMSEMPEEMRIKVTPLMEKVLFQPCWVDLDDISIHAMYLSSPLAKSITGTIQPIDKGFTFV